MLGDFFKKCFPKVYCAYEKRFDEISKVGYVGLEEYKQDILDIDNEIKEINLTIDYYKARRKVLVDWKKIIEIEIGKWDELNNCRNCRFCNNLYCSKFDFKVYPEATCDDFEWK